MRISAEQLKGKFPDFDNELINDISEFGFVKEVESGDAILKTGQSLTYAIVVIRGAVKIYREGDEGGEFLLYYLDPGQACSMSLSCMRFQEESQIMGVAVEDSELLLIPIEKVSEWMRVHRTWQEYVINSYRNRFEEVLTVLDSVAFRSMDERLEFYLKREAIHNKSNKLHLSHQAIANDLNTSREVVSRLLKKMEQRGWLTLNRNQIDLLQTESNEEA